MISTLKISSSSSKLTPQEKKEKTMRIRDFHKPTLMELNVPDSNLSPKYAFKFKGMDVIGVFPSEFRRTEGFFIEFVDSYLEPVDENRRLWKLSYRENYEDIYELLPSGSYAVPLTDLEEVKIEKKIPSLNFNISSSSEEKRIEDEVTDEHYSKMTITDLAAILWQKPVSKKKWLNNLIMKTNQELF